MQQYSPYYTRCYQYWGQKHNSFDDVAKDFITISLTKYNEYGNLETNQIILSVKELQAINKKVRELRLDIMKINNLKESIEYFKKINDYGNGGN